MYVYVFTLYGPFPISVKISDAVWRSATSLGEGQEEDLLVGFALARCTRLQTEDSKIVKIYCVGCGH